jgi:hypothetical protein
MVEDNDWRITNQAKYLHGVTVQYRCYQKPNAEWDHEHCSFCWAKFMDEADLHAQPDALHEGYLTEDNHWICTTCFNDFREQFDWHVF